MIFFFTLLAFGLSIEGYHLRNTAIENNRVQVSLKKNENAVVLFYKDDCSVAQDNMESGCLAVRHLLSCGRTRIAIIAGDSEYSVTHERMRGALKALHDAGLQLAGEARFGPWEAE